VGKIPIDAAKREVSTWLKTSIQTIYSRMKDYAAHLSTLKCRENSPLMLVSVSNLLAGISVSLAQTKPSVPVAHTAGNSPPPSCGLPCQAKAKITVSLFTAWNAPLQGQTAPQRNGWSVLLIARHLLHPVPTEIHAYWNFVTRIPMDVLQKSD
jgi:hypothetical protein